MVAYLDEVKAISMKIKDFKICQIFREENEKVDTLGNLVRAFDFISYRSVPLEFLLIQALTSPKTFVKQQQPRHGWMTSLHILKMENCHQINSKCNKFSIGQLDFASSMEHCIKGLFWDHSRDISN